MPPAIARTVRHRLAQWFVNDELEGVWKEAGLQRLRRTAKDLMIAGVSAKVRTGNLRLEATPALYNGLRKVTRGHGDSVAWRMGFLFRSTVANICELCRDPEKVRTLSSQAVLWKPEAGPSYRVPLLLLHSYWSAVCPAASVHWMSCSHRLTSLSFYMFIPSFLIQLSPIGPSVSLVLLLLPCSNTFPRFRLTLPSWTGGNMFLRNVGNYQYTWHLK
jgi:hypothetical protein